MTDKHDNCTPQRPCLSCVANNFALNKISTALLEISEAEEITILPFSRQMQVLVAATIESLFAVYFVSTDEKSRPLARTMILRILDMAEENARKEADRLEAAVKAKVARAKNKLH